MKQILLTSAGLTDVMQSLFFSRVPKRPEQIRIMLVPCASLGSDGAREGIIAGMAGLLQMGIRKENIFLYNLAYLLSHGYRRTYSAAEDLSTLPLNIRLPTRAEIREFDAILFTGGRADVLMDEILRTGFRPLLAQAVDDGLFYIGVSAGSMVAAGNFANSMGFLKNPVIPHCPLGLPCGNVPENGEIPLTDKQAVWITDAGAQIIE